jgi:hypothetical protein
VTPALTLRQLDVELSALASEDDAIAADEPVEVLTCFPCRERTAVPLSLLDEWEARHAGCGARKDFGAIGRREGTGNGTR